MSGKQIIENLQARIRQLEKRTNGTWHEPTIDGLREAVRLIKCMEESEKVDWTLQTR